MNFNKLINMIMESLQGMGVNSIAKPAGTQGSAKQGSSGWSSAMNIMTDEDEEDQGYWQSNLTNIANKYK